MIGLLGWILSAAAAPRPQVAPAASEEVQGFLKRLVEAHGLDRLVDQGRVRFVFRGASFEVVRDHGLFRYSRTVVEDGVKLEDVLTNAGFEHRRDGVVVELSEARRAQRSNSVNSVVYFALLPLPLLDPAVRAVRLVPATIDGRSYERVEVRFTEQGGGDDHDDSYLYWFDAKTLRLGFLAYRFHTGEGGVRFRVAKNERTVGGVTVFDYDNYSHPDLGIELARLPSLRVAAEGEVPVKLLSEIVLEQVEVSAP